MTKRAIGLFRIAFALVAVGFTSIRLTAEPISQDDARQAEAIVREVLGNAKGQARPPGAGLSLFVPPEEHFVQFLRKEYKMPGASTDQLAWKYLGDRQASLLVDTNDLRFRRFPVVTGYPNTNRFDLLVVTTLPTRKHDGVQRHILMPFFRTASGVRLNPFLIRINGSALDPNLTNPILQMLEAEVSRQ